MVSSTRAGSRSALTLAAGLMVLAMPASGASETCPSVLVAAIPARPAMAPNGRDFMHRIAGLGGESRETVIEAELLAGNLPSFLTRLKPVDLEGRVDGKSTTITICVTPDYLAVGVDEDFLRVPMALPTALNVAGRFGFILPTARMVDRIYEQSEVHLKPEPLPAGAAMRSTDYYWRHEQLIRAQQRGQGKVPGALMAGQKKDLVLSPRLAAKPDRVAIYGWHRGVGQPIQPLSTVHGARYADYSHGVRLVSLVAYVDGRSRSIADLLADPKLGPFLSDEGPIDKAASLPGSARGWRLLTALLDEPPESGGSACTVMC